MTFCFGEDGFFYPVTKDENGCDVPDYSEPHVADGEGFKPADENSLPHNEANPGTLASVEVE